MMGLRTSKIDQLKFRLLALHDAVKSGDHYLLELYSGNSKQIPNK